VRVRPPGSWWVSAAWIWWTWTNDPTSFTYSWERNGTPISGATGATYVVVSIDEGNTLRCKVTASNVAGAGPVALSARVLIAVPVVARCPRATGRASATAIGLVHLGESRARVRRAFTHSSNRGRAYQDFFCLTPIGIRVGYASPILIRGLGSAVAGRFAGTVIWISTANPFYAIDGIREEIGIAVRVLTTGRKTQRIFLTSFQ
jgi:hypothetical protein